MSEGIVTTQDIGIKSCLITGSSGRQIDFKNMIVEFNYYEDIFANGISGALVVNDSMGYINILELQGSEVLSLIIDKPGLELPIVGNYRIYTISNRTQTNSTNQNYIIKFCSEELFLNDQYRISKSYTKVLISDIVIDIAYNQLKIPQSALIVDNTTGLRDIVVPNFKPIQAINWLATFALAGGSQNVGAPFFFYEDRDGWKFKSLLTLYKLPVYKTYQYSIKGSKSDKNPLVTDLNTELVNVLQYEHIKSFDSISAAKNGVFANKLHTVDPLRLKLGETDFNYSKYLSNNPASLNKYNIPDTAKNRKGDTMSDASAVVKFCMTTSGQNDNEYIKNKKITINENLVEQTIPLRTAQIALFCINRMKLLIPGDVYMTIGKVIEFNLPQISYNKDSRQKDKDEFYSGKYLVTAVRHLFNQAGTYVTCIEICKDSSPTQYGAYNNSDSGWSSLR